MSWRCYKAPCTAEWDANGLWPSCCVWGPGNENGLTFPIMHLITSFVKTLGKCPNRTNHRLYIIMDAATVTSPTGLGTHVLKPWVWHFERLHLGPEGTIFGRERAAGVERGVDFFLNTIISSLFSFIAIVFASVHFSKFLTAQSVCPYFWLGLE